MYENVQCSRDADYSILTVSSFRGTSLYNYQFWH